MKVSQTFERLWKLWTSFKIMVDFLTEFKIVQVSQF